MSAQLNSLLQSARMKERSEVKKTLGKEFSYLTQSKSKTKRHYVMAELLEKKKKKNQAKHEYEELLFL